MSVVLTEVERYEGSSNGKPWVKFTLKDGNGEAIGATFDSAIADTAKSLVGQRVDVDTTPPKDPKYAPTVTAVRPAKVEEAASDDRLSKSEWRAKDLAKDRRACIAIAASSLTHTLKSDPARDDVTNFASNVLHLANIFYADVERVYGLPADKPLSQHDEDIPF